MVKRVVSIICSVLICVLMFNGSGGKNYKEKIVECQTTNVISSAPSLGEYEPTIIPVEDFNTDSGDTMYCRGVREC